MLSGADLPMPGSLVDVVRGEAVVTARVEQLRPTGLVLELPVQPLGDGPVQLFWHGAEGVRTVPARVLMRWSTRGAVRCQVAPDGPSAPGNRRDAVRAPLRLRVRVTGRGADTVHLGRTLDVSETGLRCLLDPADRVPEVGAPVDVGLVLRGAVFPLPGRVHTARPTEDGWDVVIAFTDLCASMADLLRAQVFAALREQRRLSLL